MKNTASVPKEFRHLELEGNNFADPGLFGIKITPNGAKRNLDIGGRVLYNNKEKTTFERAIFRSGKKKDKVIQLIKSKCVHSEFNKNLRLMFCEYIFERKIRSASDFDISIVDKKIVSKEIPNTKTFEEEAKIEPTEREWNLSLKYGAGSVLKVIRFSEDFKKYESVSINLPLVISSKDKAKIYDILESKEFWQEEKLNLLKGEFHERIKIICENYYPPKEERDESEQIFDKPVKVSKWNKLKEILSTFQM